MISSGLIIHTGCFESPIGWMQIGSSEEEISMICFTENYDRNQTVSTLLIREMVDQLKAYFEGRLYHFDIPFRQEGSAFQQKVWTKLKDIPFGTTITYSELAKEMGKPDATRAVAAANGKNKLNILIPCHRVIGTKNKLTGYNGGIERKRWLLQHERSYALNKIPDRLF